MSPDVTSPYLDRPIRPLPKRRLRERLSPDVADMIKYPPAPKTITPLFYHHYNAREETGANGLVESQHPSGRGRGNEVEPNYISRRNGEQLESDEDEVEAAYRSRIYSRHSADNTGRSFRYVQKPYSKYPIPRPHPPASTSSSADGYDSFENTNNKKKRKIPTPGDSSSNGVHLSCDVIGNIASGPEDMVEDIGVGPYPSSGGGQGISGPGRGRYGRIRNGRSPLRTLSDASSNWGNGRLGKQKQPQWPSTSESPGIISRSIASANAVKIPVNLARGQENVSLLQQQAAKRSTPASAQFTFTCDSQVPGTVAWPGPSNVASMHTSSAARMSTHATQTSPNMQASQGSSHVAQAKPGLPASHHASNGQKQSSSHAPPKKNHRRTGKEYIIAARQRRHQQEFRNYHHPPAPGDIWICEFCEYERIFGTPPEALIKQYEIKDRRVRKQEAERRRLLEKAKMKGRKGKKGNKAVPKAAAPPDDRQAQHQQQTTLNQSQSQGTQSEEYYEDEYDDDYAQDNPSPLSPVSPPSLRRTAVALNPDGPPIPIGVDSRIIA
ncbi:hypothetical protein PZA11_005396 [Diplocarpon coronariae]|uniref:Uncharacterized protein n=1 Tax=Diplocarpon coronariae TaxID=2795749 RepID=A0A218YZN6_9HELO|nr:hypothetical protein JHW43_007597 [Diplocarpon mali]OWP00476.1 hypothetical protein B2J93_332 [Marssonina coronariae]